MAKTKNENGFYINITGWVPLNGDINKIAEVSAAAVEGQRTGNYQHLISMTNIEKATVEARSRRRPAEPEEEAPVEPTPLEEAIAATVDPLAD